MIVRKLDFLMPFKGYKKVETDIYDEEKISTVYIKNNGYCIYIEGREDEMYLIKSSLSPDELALEENSEERKDFINLLELLLEQIYENVDIPEYETQHHEFVFLKIMDLFEKDEFKVIERDSDLYKTIELGFIKFDIDLLNHESLNNGGG